MFTGIIETLGTVRAISINKSNKIFEIESSVSNELQVDQSIAHNGICLTVTEINGNIYKVTAIAETLAKTNLNLLSKNDKVNLERCMVMNGRLDGHIVQGHIDQTGICDKIEDQGGSYLISFSYDGKAGITVPIIPGIKPITSLKQIQILPKTFHIDIPEILIEELEKCNTDKEVREVGIEWCIQQSKELIKEKTPCLHFYTMGTSETTRRVASKVF